ncbi:MAG: protein kinase family protein [Gammaproteobacteria bacterium]|nr:protein kinase family protein [Gammaproteobacteria bacterium]
MDWKKFNFEDSDLTYNKLIGQGSYARVYRGTLGALIIATKELFFKATDSFNDESPKNSFPEFYIQRQLTEKAMNSDETGILEIFGFCMLKLSRYAIFPHCEFSLDHAMPVIHKLRASNEKNAQELYQKIVLGFFLSMLNALKTLSNNNIVHRDIKPANILFSPNENQDALMRWCLSDFGCAFDLTQGKATGTHGTPNYFAPESRKETRHYDLHTNTWGFAHTIFEMFNAENLNRISTYFLLDGEIAHYSSQEHSKQIRTLLGITLPEKIYSEEQTFRHDVNEAKTFSTCINSTAKKMHQEVSELRASLQELEFAAKKLSALSPRPEESDRSHFLHLVHDHLTKKNQPSSDYPSLVSGSGSQRHSVPSPKMDALISPQQPQIAEDALDDSQFDEGLFLDLFMGAPIFGQSGVDDTSDESDIRSVYESRQPLPGVSSLSQESRLNAVIQNGFRQLEMKHQMCAATMIAEAVLIPRQSKRHLDESNIETGVKLVSQWQLFLMNFKGDASWLLGENPSSNAKFPVSQLIPTEFQLQHQKWVHTMFSGKKNIESNWYSFFNGMLKRPTLFLAQPAAADAPDEPVKTQPVCIDMQFQSAPDNNSALSRHWLFSVVFKRPDTPPTNARDTINPNKNGPTFFSGLGSESAQPQHLFQPL